METTFFRIEIVAPLFIKEMLINISLPKMFQHFLINKFQQFLEHLLLQFGLPAGANALVGRSWWRRQ
jgi:hypothetical protein